MMCANSRVGTDWKLWVMAKFLVGKKLKRIYTCFTIHSALETVECISLLMTIIVLLGKEFFSERTSNLSFCLSLCLF